MINDNELADWKPSLADPQRAEVQVERYLPFVTRTGPDEWRHDHTGEVYDLQELLETFSDAFPDQVHARAYGGTKIPETLIEITGQIDCHLIETQRLLILRDDRPEQVLQAYTPAAFNFGDRQKGANAKGHYFPRTECLRDVISISRSVISKAGDTIHNAPTSRGPQSTP